LRPKEIRQGHSLKSNSGSQIDFFLSEPLAYTFFGRYSLETDDGDYGGLTMVFATGLSSVVDSRGFPIFNDQFATSSGLLVRPGTSVIQHSGILLPGRYVLSGGLASIFEHTTTTFPSRRGRLGFDFSFTLDPAPAPIPEPTTLVLLGAGLVGVATRASRRGKRRV
jgi:hypothetical protein